MTGDGDLAAFYEAIYERLVPIFPVGAPALHGGQGCGS
jgi:hypothetical protein